MRDERRLLELEAAIHELLLEAQAIIYYDRIKEQVRLTFIEDDDAKADIPLHHAPGVGL